MSEHDAPEWQAPTDEQLRRALVLVGHPERARLFYPGRPTRESTHLARHS